MGIAVSFFSRLVSRPGILTLVITTGGICGLVYGNIGVEETQSVDRAEIDEPVMVFGNASADETSLWDVVGVIVGIETFFRGDKQLIPVLVLAQMLPFLSSLIALMCVLGSPSFL